RIPSQAGEGDQTVPEKRKAGNLSTGRPARAGVAEPRQRRRKGENRHPYSEALSLGKQRTRGAGNQLQFPARLERAKARENIEQVSLGAAQVSRCAEIDDLQYCSLDR